MNRHGFRKGWTVLLLLITSAASPLLQWERSEQRTDLLPTGNSDEFRTGSWFTKEEFAQRRQRLMRQITDGIAVILGAETPSAYVRFRQNNTFYYFTGVEMPDCALIMDGVRKQSSLFVPQKTLVDIPDEAMVRHGSEGEKKTGIERVLPRESFSSVLFRLAARSDVHAVYILFAPEELEATSRDIAKAAQRRRAEDAWDSRLSRAHHLERWLREQFPSLTIKDLTPMVDELRWVKSAAEIAVMRQCGRIGAMGIAEAIRATRPGLFEFQLAAFAKFVFEREGAQGIAFHPIVVSGENTIRLHYTANNRRLKEGDIVLMDFAPEFNYYVTDITRVWPVSGVFTDEQRKIYECVLDAHKKIIAAVKPGVKVADLAAIGKAVFEQHGFEKNWMGGVGHFIGMSTHDPGFYDRPFVPGVVFNVEPMFMDKDKKIHMRLEDTIVVTEDGHENFTAGVPVEVEGIYKLMRGQDIKP